MINDTLFCKEFQPEISELNIFADLTVRENLTWGPFCIQIRLGSDRILIMSTRSFSFSPSAGISPAAPFSCGEQQMLAMSLP